MDNQNRNEKKKDNNIGCFVFIILIIIVIVISIANLGKKSYVYTSEGITISTDQYLEKSYRLGKVLFLQNKNIGLEISAEKHTFEKLEQYGINQNSTIEDYLNYVLKTNKYYAKIETDGDLVYYTNSFDNYLFITAKKTNKAFYLFTFSAPKDSAQSFKEEFIDCAKIIKIND